MIFPEYANAAKNNQHRPRKQGGSGLYSYFLNHRGWGADRNLSIAGEKEDVDTVKIRERRTDSTFGIWPPNTADIYNCAAWNTAQAKLLIIFILQTASKECYDKMVPECKE